MASKGVRKSSYGRVLKPTSRYSPEPSTKPKKAPRKKKPSQPRKNPAAAPKRGKGRPKAEKPSSSHKHEDCTVTQLKSLLKARKISTMGMTKPQLLQAATDSDKQHVAGADYQKLTARELEGLLDCLGIDRPSENDKITLIKALLGYPRMASVPAPWRPDPRRVRAATTSPTRALARPPPKRSATSKWTPYNSHRASSPPTTTTPAVPRKHRAKSPSPESVPDAKIKEESLSSEDGLETNDEAHGEEDADLSGEEDEDSMS